MWLWEAQVADNLLRPPTPNMQGRELIQWLQRVYDVLQKYQTTPDPIPPDIPTSHDELTENGGTSSHATITSHLNASTAHGRSSALVGVTDTQILTNKLISGDDNTISDLHHGIEVDNPTVAHGTTTAVVGVDDSQTLTNKTILGQNNTVRNMRHGVEVDNWTTGVHGVMGSVVGTENPQILFNKSFLYATISVPGDYTATLLGANTIIATQPGIIITLPTIPGEFTGLQMVVDNKSDGNITVAPQADATTIEGETTQTMPPDSAMTMRFDGSSWRIV